MQETYGAPAHDESSFPALRTELHELSPQGEVLSGDEIDLVAGGAKSCPHTKPSTDDFTCSGGWVD